MKALLAVFALALVACGGDTDDTSSTATGGTSSGGTSSGGTSSGGTSSGGTSSGGAGGTSEDCAGGGLGVLGMTITFPEPVQCTFTLAEAAAGIQIDYQLVVDQDAADIVPQAQQSCPGAPGASNLYLFEKLSGGNESYCICDNGLCPAPPDDPITIQAGTYPGIFEWDGQNWSGPSDTGNPKGPAFPPGKYTLSVSTKGTHGGQPFEVEGNLVITLTP